MIYISFVYILSKVGGCKYQPHIPSDRDFVWLKFTLLLHNVILNMRCVVGSSPDSMIMCLLHAVGFMYEYFLRVNYVCMGPFKFVDGT